MGMTIDDFYWSKKFQKLQADYEKRLKADLKAILVELQLQMEEYEPKWVENDEQVVASCRTWEDLDGIIQNKINSLKEEKTNVDTDTEQTTDNKQ